MSAPLPHGYNTVMPYIIVINAVGLMSFMKSVFGAIELQLHMREDGKTLMHGEVRIGESVLMFAESTDDYAPQPSGLFICVDDADKVYESALAAGATSIMPPTNQGYGRSSGIKDPYGNTWWITTVK